MEEHGCVPRNLLICKKRVSWIWPTSHNLPALIYTIKLLLTTMLAERGWALLQLLTASQWRHWGCSFNGCSHNQPAKRCPRPRCARPSTRMPKQSQNLRMEEGLSDHFHTSQRFGQNCKHRFTKWQDKLSKILVKIRDHLESTNHCHLPSIIGKALFSTELKWKVDLEMERLSGDGGGGWTGFNMDIYCLMQQSRLSFSVVFLPQPVEYGVPLHRVIDSTLTIHTHVKERCRVPVPGTLLVSRVLTVQ